MMEILNRYTGNPIYKWCDNADLRNADLSGVDLRYAYLRGVDLRNAYLRDADLRNADLRDADLRDADLRNADLSGVDLRYAEFYGCKNDNLLSINGLSYIVNINDHVHVDCKRWSIDDFFNIDITQYKDHNTSQYKMLCAIIRAWVENK